MPYPLLPRFTRLGSAIVLCGLLNLAQAAELGETLVRSYAGQPLVADIELTAFADEGSAVQVKLAHPDVYRGANIAMHPLLSGLNMSVMRRDGRQFLHITSVKPVNADFIHLFLELSEGGRRNVRGTTLWFGADPAPAAPVTATAPAAAVPAAAVAGALLAPRRAAPPPPPPVRVAPRITPLAPAAAPAACVQQFSSEQIAACAASDGKNAALTAQIAVLEAKVQQLQVAIQAKPAVAAPLRAAAAPAAAAAAVADVPKTGAVNWLYLGLGLAAALAALGTLLAAMVRRKKRKPAPALPAPSGFMAGVKHRLMPAKRLPEPAGRAGEPSL